ncbi:hypothetical protein M5689_000931 [Euphorbia peplus]|nr:hypothetical protein M5689_000931 [Euphorbia peplus]
MAEPEKSIEELLKAVRPANTFSMVDPPIAVDDFELKTALIQMIQNSGQFSGEYHEDPNAHLDKFMSYCNTCKVKDVPQEHIYMKLFRFSLRGEASEWLHYLAPDSLTDWETTMSAFLSKYFPPQKTAQFKSDITFFKQFESESLGAAWERFQRMIRKCPHHGFPDHMIAEGFYNGISSDSRAMIDASAGGNVFRKGPKETLKMMKEVAERSAHWTFEKPMSRRGVFQVEPPVVAAVTTPVVDPNIIALAEKMELMMAKLTPVEPPPKCEFCAASHKNTECPIVHEQVMYMRQNGGYQNNYNAPWRQNHPGFSWTNNEAALNPPPPGFQNTQTQYQGDNNKGFQNQNQHQKQPSSSSDICRLEEKIDMVVEIVSKLSVRVNDNEALCKGMDTRLNQFAKEVSERPRGHLPHMNEVNPKAVMAITVISEDQIGTPEDKSEPESGKSDSDSPPHEVSRRDNDVSRRDKLLSRRDNEVSRRDTPLSRRDNDVSRRDTPLSPRDTSLSRRDTNMSPRDKVSGSQSDLSSASPAQVSPPKLFADPNVRPKDVPLPFPVTKQSKLAKEYAKIYDLFKKIEINLPFLDLLQTMPAYGKFLKDLISTKRKFGDQETVMLSQECSAILTNTLPKKAKDPGSFSIPCTIGTTHFQSALCDLGASINLMPLSVYRKLGMGDPAPTSVTIQLADRSVRRPVGIVEDLLVKVGHFIFPADFVILDIKEDARVPIILGRPFLATGRTLIDVEGGKLILRLQNEKLEFNIYKAIKLHAKNEHCNLMQCTDPLIAHDSQETEESQLIGDLEPGDPKKECELVQHVELLDEESIPKTSIDPLPVHKLVEDSRERKAAIRWEKRFIPRKFQQGDDVLLYNSGKQWFSGKWKSKWSGPYQVTYVFPSGLIEITNGKETPFRVNGHQLKRCDDGLKVVERLHIDKVP